MRIAAAVLFATLPAAGISAREPFYTTPVPNEATLLRALDPQQREHTLYAESHALLIGQEAYENWDRLPAVRREVLDLTDALERHRFKVEVHFDLKAAEFAAVVDDFMRRRATVPESRIVVYVSGHAWGRVVMETRPIGYILPVDAPPPATNAAGRQALAASALSMSLFEGWAQMPDPRHMLFVFDACFSGSFFGLSTADPPPDPRPASSGAQAVAAPRPASPSTSPAARGDNARGFEADDHVFRFPGPRARGRQFLTAGSHNETAPVDSVFSRLLIDILRGPRTEDVQANFDNWTLASEMGGWLVQNTRRLYRGRQHPTTPMFGSLRDRDYAGGDMAFVRLDRPDGPALPDGLDHWRNFVRTTPDPPQPSAAEVARALASVEAAVRRQAEAEEALRTAQQQARRSEEEAVRSRQDAALRQQEAAAAVSRTTAGMPLERPEAVRLQNEAARLRNEEAESMARASAAQREAELSSQRAAVARADVAQARQAAVAADPGLRTAAVAPPRGDRRLSPEDERELQAMVNALSSDDTEVRRRARTQLASFLRERPAPQAEAATERLLRDLRHKSYRYQVGVAVALAEPRGVLRVGDAEEARREMQGALEATRDSTLKQHLTAALRQVRDRG